MRTYTTKIANFCLKSDLKERGQITQFRQQRTITQLHKPAKINTSKYASKVSQINVGFKKKNSSTSSAFGPKRQSNTKLNISWNL